MSRNSIFNIACTSFPTKIFLLVISENTCITSRISVFIKLSVTGKLSYNSVFKLASTGAFGSLVLIIFFLFRLKFLFEISRVGPNWASLSTFSF